MCDDTFLKVFSYCKILRNSTVVKNSKDVSFLVKTQKLEFMKEWFDETFSGYFFLQNSKK